MAKIQMYRFSEIPDGKCFEYEGNSFRKIPQSEDANAINLHTNRGAYFIENARVYGEI